MAKRVNAFDSKDTVAARVPLSEMVVDEYQGHVNQALVDKIAERWDDSAAGAIILNFREDYTYAVLDGQHRVLAAKKRGEPTELNALVFVGKSKEEEARLFVMLNTKHNVRTMDRFRANLVAGCTAEKNIVRSLREVGLDVALSGPKIDHLQCPGYLTKIYNDFGPTAFKTAVGIITSAFSKHEDRMKAYSGPAIYGLAQVLFRFPEINIQRLINKLAERAPTTLTGMAALRRDPKQEEWVGWAKVMVGLYNSGFKSNFSSYLPIDRLDKKKYTPMALASIKVKKSRVDSLAKARKAAQLKLAAKREKK